MKMQLYVRYRELVCAIAVFKQTYRALNLYRQNH